jgi:hypothetical protein
MVDKLCSYCDIVGVAHHIIEVRELPPSDDLRILVRGEFLNGICSDLPLAFIDITWVKKNKLLLMCLPSFTLSWILDEIMASDIMPEFSTLLLWWLLTFSLPARSIKFSILSFSTL